MTRQSDHGQGISVRNVSMHYPSAPAPSLDRVSLEIEPGEFMTFLGPSGSGKTTLLSVIAGFVNPTDGHVAIGGSPIDGLKPHLRDLGVVFQNYLLFPHLSVFENIAYPLRQRKVSKADITTRVEKALQLVQLDAYADRVPSELSGGQQQRVAFARAIVYDPRALLMDEPLGALDKNLRSEMQRELARIHRELGMTFVFVTHDQEEALVLSDRIAVFNQGRIEQVGTPEDLYYRPTTLFVARFLGDSNVFHGELSTESRQFTSAAGTVDVPHSPSINDRSNVLILRPEALRVTPDDGSDPNGFLAQVSEVVFTGSNVTVHLTFADGSPGIARLAAEASRALAVGHKVRVSWPVSRQHLLLDEKS